MMTTKQTISHRQAQKEDTKRIILDSAYLLFAKKGYEKTTMRALAKQAGVGLGTIFKHFPDKPTLLVAAFQEDLNKIVQNSFSSLPESGLKNQLLHITGNIFGFYAENPEFSRTLIKEIIFLEGEHGKVLQNDVLLFLNKISELIKMAQSNGEINIDFSPQDGALAFWSFYFIVLVIGLKQPTFDIDTQSGMLEALINNHFYNRK